MSEVVDIKDYRPHRSGEAKCTGCGHKWVAVIAVEDDCGSLECPECGFHKGRWHGGYGAPNDEPVFVCGCGNDYFEMVMAGAHCPSCDTTHDWETLQSQ